MDVLHVCISCRYHAEQRFLNGKRGGMILCETLDAKLKESQVPLEVRPAECLSACRSYSTLAFTGSHKMTMVFGRLNVAEELEATCEALASYARDYCGKADGLVLRADRPSLLQDKLLARIPPPDGLAKL